jgi:peptide/nickel transport system substrate-binding protein
MRPDAAGEPVGSRQPVRLVFTIEADPAHAAAARAYAERFRAFGLRADVSVRDRSQIIARARTGVADAWVVGWAGPHPAPLGMAVAKLTTGGAENFTGYANPETDLLLAGLINRWKAEERKRLARVLQEMLLEELPWVRGAVVPLCDASTADLTGWVPGPAGGVSLHDALVSEGEDRVTVLLGLARLPPLDPFASPDPQAGVILRCLFDALVTVGPDGTLLPELAESWEYSPTARELVVKLRNGVLFHNGEPLRARDVVFTYTKALTGRVPPGVRVHVFEGGEREVVFKFSVPFPGFLELHGLQPVVPALHYEEVGPERFARAPVGTGPFRLVPGGGAGREVLVRWEGYYGGCPEMPPCGPASLREVVLRCVPEPERRVKMLLEGRATLALALGPDEARALEEAGTAVVLSEPGSRAVFLELNCRRPPFDDLRVRLALNLLAVPCEELPGGPAAPGSEGVPLPGAFLPEGFGYLGEEVALPDDPGLGLALLQEAGYLVGEE